MDLMKAEKLLRAVVVETQLKNLIMELQVGVKERSKFQIQNLSIYFHCNE